MTKQFGDLKACDNINLEIPSGQMIGIIGRSGAGKSTLLRAINRLGDATEGSIIFGEGDEAFDVCKLGQRASPMACSLRDDFPAIQFGSSFRCHHKCFNGSDQLQQHLENFVEKI